MNAELKKYISTNIFPVYEKNDGGHGIEHINYVINRSLKFAEQFPNIDSDIVYTIASFHDIAHHIDKKNHEKLSAQMFFENEDMKIFFTNEQRVIIKQAIEDHRASSETPPRSDYGKIISSADRSTDVVEFLRRTHAYTLKHFPGCTQQDAIDRAYDHTAQKYGKNGYAKSFVVDEEYEDFRDYINLILDDKENFSQKYREINEL